MNTWKSIYHVYEESQAKRLERQSKLLDKLGLPELADKVQDRITPFLDRINEHTKNNR